MKKLSLAVLIIIFTGNLCVGEIKADENISIEKLKEFDAHEVFKGRHGVKESITDIEFVTSTMLLSSGKDGWLKKWEVNSESVKISSGYEEKKREFLELDPGGNGETLALFSRSDEMHNYNYEASTFEVRTLQKKDTIPSIPVSGGIAITSAGNILTIPAIERSIIDVPFQLLSVFIHSSFAPDRYGFELVSLSEKTERKNAKKYINHSSNVIEMSISASDTFLATGAGNNQVNVWNFKKRSVLATYYHNAPYYDAQILDLEFSPDGKYLLSSGGDGVIKRFDTQEKEVVKNYYSGKDYPIGQKADRTHPEIEILPDNNWFASTTWNGELMIWNLNQRRPVKSIEVDQLDEGNPKYPEPGEHSFNDNVNAMDISPDGNTIAVGLKDGRIKLYRIEFN